MALMPLYEEEHSSVLLQKKNKNIRGRLAENTGIYSRITTNSTQ